MSEYTMWHNPRCSKSRKTLELLLEHSVEPKLLLYLETPPTANDLDRVLTALGKDPREFMRTKEAAYTELNLANPELTRAQLITAMVENPTLLERPVVISGDRAALGRPPEAVLDLLQ